MTDFAHVQAATIDPSASLAVANDYMITRGVRSLFVTSPEGRMLGLITTRTSWASGRCARATRTA